MRVAQIRITPELLRDLLGLPFSCEIVGSKDAVGEIAVVVSDPALPVREEGRDIPVVVPTFKRNQPIELVSWNL